MEKIGEDAAAKFINALIKSVQTLCHGYLEFQNGIEIIGHINLSVDKGNSLDYILKEKVCKNAENSTLFISNSFHAEAKPEEKDRRKQIQSDGGQGSGSSDSIDQNEVSRVSSAISSICSSLAGSRDKHRRTSDAKDSHSSHYKSSSKRRSSSDQSSEFHSAKIPHLSSESSHRGSSSPARSRTNTQGLSTSDGTSETLLPQTANVSGDNSDLGVNLVGSVLEPVENQNDSDLAKRDDDSDGDLEVTFIKEEYGQGDGSDFNNTGHQFAESSGQRDGSSFPVTLHAGSGAPFMPGSFDHGQQFSPGDIGPSTSQSQPGPSGMRGDYGMTTQAASIAQRLSMHPSSYPIDFQHQLDFSGMEWTLASTENFSMTSFRKATGFLVCGLCGKNFTSSSGLARHKRCVHSSRRLPYTCTICGKGFHDKETHEGHVNMHNNIKAYKCSKCGKEFMYKTSLYHHVRNSAVCSASAMQKTGS